MHLSGSVYSTDDVGASFGGLGNLAQPNESKEMGYSNNTAAADCAPQNPFAGRYSGTECDTLGSGAGLRTISARNPDFLGAPGYSHTRLECRATMASL
jgi:hypothetical protein